VHGKRDGIDSPLRVMNDRALEAGVSRARGRQALSVGAAQFGVPSLVTPPKELPKEPDRVYASNEHLWQALINERVRATMIVQLPDFWLSEWFPLRPGLFHTPAGHVSRQTAQRFLLSGPGAAPDARKDFERWFGRTFSPELISRLPPNAHVYDPRGKSLMLDGGVGCVRLKARDLLAGRAWFMGASSTAVAHEGVPVAVPDSLYGRVIERIAARGACRCQLIGRLTHIPEDLDPLYRDLVGLPQLYVMVEQLEFSRTPADTLFLANGAVLIEAQSTGEKPEHEWALADGIYAAYVSFLPGIPNAIHEAAAWLSEIYVGELLDGRVLTDFDEQVRRFSGTAFSLEKVMGGGVSTIDAERFLGRCAASAQTRQEFTYRIGTLNIGMIGDILVMGDKNIVAGPGGAAAGPGGVAAAGNSAAAAGQAAASAGHSSARVGLAARAKASVWAKLFGFLAVVSTLTATLLLIAGITEVGIAGYIVAVISIVVGVIPLFRD
jgi:hypothetical protein